MRSWLERTSRELPSRAGAAARIRSPMMVWRRISAHSLSEQRAALFKDRFRDRHLADVVERGGVAQRLEVAAGQPELLGDLAGELADRIHVRGQVGSALGEHRHQDMGRLQRGRRAAGVLLAVHARVGEREHARGASPFVRQQHGAVGCRDREPVSARGERGRAERGELVEVRIERREHAELVATDAVGVTAPGDGGGEGGAELVEQDVARAVAVAVVVGLESVEVEQKQGVRRLLPQDAREVDLQPPPVAQPGQWVRGRLDAARGEQRVILAQGERHPHEHEPERRDREAERDRVDMQRHGEGEHAQCDGAERDRHEQAATRRLKPRRRLGRRQRGSRREADEGGGHQRVGDNAAGSPPQDFM